MFSTSNEVAAADQQEPGTLTLLFTFYRAFRLLLSSAR
jgi:hypothetical protein